MKSVIAVIAGIITGTVVLFLIEGIGHVVVPPPRGVDPLTPEGAAAIMAAASTETLLLVLVAYFAGPFAGGAVAARLAPNKRYVHAMVVGGVQMLLAVINLTVLPHPGWFWIATVAVFIPAAMLGALMVAGRSMA